MSRSLYEANEEQKAKYNTKNNTFEMFPVGTRVKVICLCQDMTFFEGNEQGKVVENSGKYLGITVKFDSSKHFDKFGFAPEDLVRIEENMKAPIKENYKTKDELQNAFQDFHRYLGAKVGMTDVEVNMVRTRANGMNSTKQEDAIELFKHAIIARKAKLEVLDAKRAKASLTAQTLQVGVENETKRIALREQVLAKLEHLTDAQWKILVQELDII